ncbi:PF13031 family protein [Bacteriovorax sp. BAL6_X]|uniref:DUF3892 domain-containing protein n=1 Tax=Bacteriovorax sp. BAL6_X TaxID=1201290 RepID=UPI000386C7A2|nr:DUF3892 domain-containing protein [Bacteriovorax sp. BAL6_X]EPZ52543.1 PF13031 family protein [Bacteriovorax sp. BAL6_X]
MTFRQITNVQKDINDNIIGVCNSGNYWSPRRATEVISDIKSGNYDYFVNVNGKKVDVLVKSNGGSEYLTTAPDNYSSNNLDNLPPC